MTDQYYSSEQTDRSFAVLGEVVNAVPEAVLIGGWASWVRTGGPMSHDIDLIVTRPQLAVLQGLTDDMSTCQSHGTWQAENGEPPGTAFTSTYTCPSNPGSG